METATWKFRGRITVSFPSRLEGTAQTQALHVAFEAIQAWALPSVWSFSVGRDHSGVNNEGMEVLRQLFRFAAKHQGLQLSVYCGRAWARLSCNIQSSVAQCFLNRAGSLAAIEKDVDFLSICH